MQYLNDGAVDVGMIGKGENGYLRVGIFSSLASGFLSQVFQSFDAHQTGVQIDFSDGHPTDHIAAVRLQQLDIAFVTGTIQHAGCETTGLWSEQVFAALPTAHPLADRHSLAWCDLIGETFMVSAQAPGREVHDYLIKRLSDLGQYPEVHRQDVGHDNLLSLVASGRGLTLISESATSTSFVGVVYRPVKGETLPFSAVWSAKNNNPVLLRLLSMALARRII